MYRIDINLTTIYMGSKGIILSILDISLGRFIIPSENEKPLFNIEKSK